MKTIPGSEIEQSAAISEFQHFCDGVGARAAQVGLDETALDELLDQTSFGLDARRFQQLTEMLDTPLAPNPGLTKLMALKPLISLDSALVRRDSVRDKL